MCFSLPVFACLYDMTLPFLHSCDNLKGGLNVFEKFSCTKDFYYWLYTLTYAILMIKWQFAYAISTYISFLNDLSKFSFLFVFYHNVVRKWVLRGFDLLLLLLLFFFFPE